MVNKCCAPYCKGNYLKEEKVSVFKFPNNRDLQTKWVAAIKREKIFVPSKNSRVCERHFDPADIIRETVYCDERTGRRLTAPLAYPRLRENAIPKILPNCPPYLSITTNLCRKSAADRQIRLEMQQVQQALSDSLISQQSYNADKSFSNFPEFVKCLEKNKHILNSSGRWKIIEEKEEVIFLSLCKTPVPKIMASVIVDLNCFATVFSDLYEIRKEQLHSISDLDHILENICAETKPNKT